MTFMIGVLIRRRVRQQCHRPRPLDGVSELPLMARATPRDPSRDDLAALGHEPPQPAHVLVVDEVDLVRTELTDLAPAEAAPLHRFLGRRNGYVLLFLERNVVIATGGGCIRRPLGRSPWRRRGRATCPTLRATGALSALGNDLRRRGLLAVFSFPIARLDPALDEYL